MKTANLLRGSFRNKANGLPEKRDNYPILNACLVAAFPYAGAVTIYKGLLCRLYYSAFWSFIGPVAALYYLGSIERFHLAFATHITVCSDAKQSETTLSTS